MILVIPTHSLLHSKSKALPSMLLAHIALFLSAATLRLFSAFTMSHSAVTLTLHGLLTTVWVQKMRLMEPLKTGHLTGGAPLLLIQEPSTTILGRLPEMTSMLLESLPQSGTAAIANPETFGLLLPE